MPLVSEMRHPKSLDFKNERRVMHLKKAGYSNKDIAKKVRHLQGKRTSKGVVRRVVKDFSPKLGRRKYKHSNCGRKATKMTSDMKKFLVKKLRELRNRVVCTSTTLQRVVKKERGVTLDASYIRKALRELGYRWQLRKQLPKKRFIKG